MNKLLKISRDPGTNVKLLLRSEVNFGCPVRFLDGSGCGCPILTYHHFDPPWAEYHHHDPEGMIALCPQHHHQADAGLWSKAQLKLMKRMPFVDSQLNVRWPWQTECMLLKVGPSFVLESGCAIRLDGAPVARFTPEKIPALGTKVALLDSTVRDTRGRHWLNIRNGWINLSLETTRDAYFTAQTKTFSVRNTDGTFLSLRFRNPTAEAFRKWVPSFWKHKDGCGTIFDTLESRGAIDSDGRIPYAEFEGHFVTDQVVVDVKKHDLLVQLSNLGDEGRINAPSNLVDYENRIVLKSDRENEFFSLG